MTSGSEESCDEEDISCTVRVVEMSPEVTSIVEIPVLHSSSVKEVAVRVDVSTGTICVVVSVKLTIAKNSTA